MKFMNSKYSKGYANFAKKGNQSRSPGRKGQSGAPTPSTTPFEAPKSQAAAKNPRGGNASSALTPAYGPQPLYGPQQKKGKLGNAKDAVAGKAQYYGAKAKNTLAKAGKFISKNKVGVGLAAAGALGAAGVAMARKMRSDKGRKRGNYSNSK
jgi:hypothetical protein